MSSRTALILGVLAAVAVPTFAVDHVVYEGDRGPGKGKHIVFIASDHEYRGEETCPAIARILAKKYGFKCTVLFGQDDDGNIKAGSSNIPGMEALDTADMMFLFLRFVNPDETSMEHFEAYLDPRRPCLGVAYHHARIQWHHRQVCQVQLQHQSPGF